MALTPKKVYAILKKYTDNAIEGAGAIKGKNCTIDSITSITGGNRVTFKWELDDGTEQTDIMDVMDGVDGADGTDGIDGVGIASITFKEKDSSGNNVYTITYTDGDTDDIVCPIGPAGADGKDGEDGAPGVCVPTGGTTGQVLKKKSGTNYDTEWADESGGGSEHGIPDGGTANQLLAKNSNTDYDVHWVDPASSSQEQSDWTQNDNSKVDYIKNKPQNLVQDANYVHTDNNYTDADKTIVANVTTDLSGKVDKETNKSLMSSDEHTKLAGIETGAEVNVLEGVQVNGVDLTIDANKKVNINISGKADKVVGATNGNFAVLDSNGNLVDSTKSPSSYYLKTETYSQSEVNTLIAAISSMNIEVVQTLPTTDISTSTIYLVPKTVGTSTTNIYDEYINTTGTSAGWELIGDTQIDLTNYVQKSSTSGLLKNDGTVDTTTYVSDVSGKADKVTSATNGNLAGLDSNGNLTDSGKNANSVIISNDFSTKRFYVDYVNGDDTKDGSTVANAIKTIDRALELAPVSRSLTIYLCSNYTGNINIYGYDTLSIRSSGNNVKRTISGYITIHDCCALTLQDLTVNTDISPYTDFIMACADLSAINGLSISNCDFVAKNADADGGYCLSISSIENARIRKTTFSVDQSSTYNVEASIFNGGSLLYIPYSSGQVNTASGANYVLQMDNFAQGYLAQGFLTNSTCTSATKIDNNGGVVYIDGVLQSEHLPIASANNLGAIKVGTNLSIDANGVLSATGGSGSTAWGNITGTLANQTDLSNALGSCYQTTDETYYVIGNNDKFPIYKDSISAKKNVTWSLIRDSLFNSFATYYATITKVEELIGETVGWVTKNLYDGTLDSIKRLNTSGTWSGNAYTYNGVTYTVNTTSDGYVSSIATSGTASEASNLLLYYGDYFNNFATKFLQDGTYIFTGCPDGGASSGSFKMLFSIGSTFSNDITSSIEEWIDMPSVGIYAGDKLTYSIEVSSGVSMASKTFYPMIRDQENRSNVFYPYHNPVAESLDEWTAEVTVSNNTATFSNLDDSYAYKLFCDEPNVIYTNTAKTGSGTSMQLVYTLSGATSSAKCKLRIIK